MGEFAIVIAVLAIIIVVLGAKRVPQGMEFTVERFGRYTKTLRPGLNLIVPLVDIIGSKMNMMEQVMDVEHAKPITVVDVMKTVRIPQDITVNSSALPDWMPDLIIPGGEFVLAEANTSFWDIVTTNQIVARNPSLQQVFVRLFYQSISYEMSLVLLMSE